MDRNVIRLFRSMLVVSSIFILTTACGQPQNIPSDAGTIKVENLASGLTHPWGMVFLPDGRLLVTERAGQLRILDQNNQLSEPVKGVPKVFAQGQGGLLDIDIDPDFENNRWVYICFSEPDDDNNASTAVGRGKWVNDELKDFEVIFRQEPKYPGPNHFGGRLVFTSNKLFITTGERFEFDPAQDLSNHLGTVIRINPDGSVPANNPFTKKAETEDEIWSYGHRNIEAAAIHPETGQLYIAEMGPRGGDELNMIVKGKNYGWPVVSNGQHYDGRNIPDHDTRPEFTQPLISWTPVISPSGMIFYTGSMFSEWKGTALIGGLTATGLVRVKIEGNKAEEVERIDLNARTRDVLQAPDGSVYVLTDQNDGNVWRLSVE